MNKSGDFEIKQSAPMPLSVSVHCAIKFLFTRALDKIAKEA